MGWDRDSTATPLVDSVQQEARCQRQGRVALDWRPQTEAGSGGVEAFLLGDLLQLAMIATPTRNGYLFSRRSRMAKFAWIDLILVEFLNIRCRTALNFCRNFSPFVPL